MSGLLGDVAGWATDVIDKLGYGGVAFLIALENVFPPIPSEVILPLAGFLAGQGRLSFGGALLAATVGAIVGALALYGLGRWFGEDRVRRLVRRFGPWLGIREADLDKANGWFDRHGGLAVLVCRLVPVVRSLVSIPAGLRRMDLVPFVIYTAIGSALWNSLLIGAGWWLGDNWEDVGRYVEYLQYVVILTAIVAALRFLWTRKISAARDRAA